MSGAAFIVMAIGVVCKCGGQLTFKDEDLGRTTHCPSCGQPVLIAGRRIAAHHVFISYSTHKKDSKVATAVCAALEAHKIRCWMAPRDITGGRSWGEAIMAGLGDSHVMVLIFSSNSNASNHVWREAERAVSKNMPIVTFRIQDVAVSKKLEYFLAGSQWLDALTPPVSQHLPRLVEAVCTLLADGERIASRPPPPPRADAPEADAPRQEWATAASGGNRTTAWVLGGAGIMAAIVIGVVLLVFSLSTPAEKSSTESTSDTRSGRIPARRDSAGGGNSRRNKPDESARGISAAVERHLNRADIYAQTGKLDLAITECTEALKIDPKSEIALLNRGLCYVMKKEYDRAIDDFTEVLRLDPSHHSAFSLRGQTYEMKGDYRKAIDDYEEASRLSPKNPNYPQLRERAKQKLAEGG